MPSGAPAPAPEGGMGIGGSLDRVRMLIRRTSRPSWSATYAYVLSGAVAMLYPPGAVVMLFVVGLNGFVMSMRVTNGEPKLATTAYFPFGVTSMPRGFTPTVIL